MVSGTIKRTSLVFEKSIGASALSVPSSYIIEIHWMKMSYKTLDTVKWKIKICSVLWVKVRVWVWVKKASCLFIPI